MDALYNDEEMLLREAITSQVEKVVPDAVHDLESFDDQDLWARLAEGDMLGLGVPEQDGGLGTLLDATIVITALGRVVAPTSYLGCVVLATQLLSRAGASADVLDGLLTGDRRLAVGFDPSLLRIARLGRDPKILAWDSRGADAALVLGTDGAVRAIDLGDDTKGFDLTRRIQVCDPATELDVGDLGSAIDDEQLRSWETTAFVAVAADLVGVMEGALKLAVTHASTRVQFGVPIGSFQAIQHLLAEALVHAEGARGLVNFAAWSVDNEPDDEARRAAHVAKAYCSEAAKKVCEAVIQVHGGMGMTWDCPVHLFQRRAIAGRSLLGDENVHYQAIARS